ncbi:hypothetical protein TURU_162800 [Turdus rufiventris]|nr:hypothetical protein TURU_162800 [Turdus rufiventris]
MGMNMVLFQDTESGLRELQELSGIQVWKNSPEFRDIPMEFVRSHGNEELGTGSSPSGFPGNYPNPIGIDSSPSRFHGMIPISSGSAPAPLDSHGIIPILDSHGIIPIPVGWTPSPPDSHGMIPIPLGSTPSPPDSHGMIPIPVGSTPSPQDSHGIIPIPVGSTPALPDSHGIIPIPPGSAPSPPDLSFPTQVQGEAGVKFRNWAGTYGSSPELFFRPSSVEEIREILELARQRGKRVKVVGGGHSPSDIACSEDFMIHMGKINRILQVDKEKLQVKVEAGILLSELNLELEKLGMALANLGAVSEVTAAGVIGTGTHNTGIAHGILPTQVVAVSLLLASGEILECSESVNPEVFQAARLHLGCLGIVVSVTFQCVPEFRLREVAFPSTLTQVLDELEEHLRRSQYFRFLWFPHSENVRIIYQDPTSKAGIPGFSKLLEFFLEIPGMEFGQEAEFWDWALPEPPCSSSSWFWDYAVGYYLLEFLLWISSFFPSLVAWINRVFFRLLFNSRVENVAQSHRMFSYECRFRQHVQDWAIPISQSIRKENARFQFRIGSFPRKFPDLSPFPRKFPSSSPGLGHSHGNSMITVQDWANPMLFPNPGPFQRKLPDPSPFLRSFPAQNSWMRSKSMEKKGSGLGTPFLPGIMDSSRSQSQDPKSIPFLSSFLGSPPARNSLNEEQIHGKSGHHSHLESEHGIPPDPNPRIPNPWKEGTPFPPGI